MEPQFIGEVKAFAFDFAPRGWAKCEGQLLNITQYEMLFKVLGTTYGGNGTSTFGLPDLRGRTLIGAGAGTGLSSYTLGQAGGLETVTLTEAQMPIHSHFLSALENTGDVTSPDAAMLATPPTQPIYKESGDGITMSHSSIANTGGGASHENRQPFRALNFCIALEGVFPTRN